MMLPKHFYISLRYFTISNCSNYVSDYFIIIYIFDYIWWDCIFIVCQSSVIFLFLLALIFQPFFEVFHILVLVVDRILY